jgi:hypothetical protein
MIPSNPDTKLRAAFFSYVCFQALVSNWQNLSGGVKILFQYRHPVCRYGTSLKPGGVLLSSRVV